MKQTTQNARTGAAPENAHPIIGFLTKFRIPMIIVGGAVLVTVAALLVVLSVQNAREERSLVAVETLEQDFADWTRLEDDQKQSALAELEMQAAAVIDEFGTGYAAVRATLLVGQAYSSLERWADAAAEFEQAAVLAEGNYLGAVALMDAAIAAENNGDTATALSLYQQLLVDYGDSSPEAPRAAFSVARILETTDRIAEAADAYRSLIDNYPASNWTNLARNRIISLTVEGRIGG